MSRRDQIAMTPEEIGEFLEGQKVLVCATNGHDGWPHLMPLWFVLRDGEPWAWTYAKSQKVRNMERDDRATVQVEDGVEYQELRGVMFKTCVELVRDVDAVTALGLEIFARYAPPGTGELPPEVEAMVRKQAVKRVGMRFAVQSVASWDHRKLAAGVY